MASTKVTRRRRQADSNIVSNNGFVTNCEARFMPIQSGGGFVLVWACPEGVESPDQEDLDGICRALFSMNLVSTCSSPSGLVLTRMADTTPLTNTSWVGYYKFLSIKSHKIKTMFNCKSKFRDMLDIIKGIYQIHFSVILAWLWALKKFYDSYAEMVQGWHCLKFDANVSGYNFFCIFEPICKIIKQSPISIRQIMW